MSKARYAIPEPPLPSTSMIWKRPLSTQELISNIVVEDLWSSNGAGREGGGGGGERLMRGRTGRKVFDVDYFYPFAPNIGRDIVTGAIN